MDSKNLQKERDAIIAQLAEVEDWAILRAINDFLETGVKMSEDADFEAALDRALYQAQTGKGSPNSEVKARIFKRVNK